MLATIFTTQILIKISYISNINHGTMKFLEDNILKDYLRVLKANCKSTIYEVII